MSQYYMREPQVLTNGVYSSVLPFSGVPVIQMQGIRGNTAVYMHAFSVVSNSLDPMDCSLPDSSVHGILQARILQ